MTSAIFCDPGEGLGDELLWRDAERSLYRGRHRDSEGRMVPVLAVHPSTSPPQLGSIDRLAHEFGLRAHLESSWAARPMEFLRERSVLLLADPGGELLARLVGAPMEPSSFLRLAIGLSKAVAGLHARGIIHKDIKPGNALVSPKTGEAWLMGFGVASHVPRERRSPVPPEVISGTFAYMAPEQTGRMNRIIDVRSDLYALGVTFYEMVTGSLPFVAVDAMEWIHCHVARQPLAPVDRVPTIPERISAIIVKLLAKQAEDRYQSAIGLHADLQTCLTQWEANGNIARFELGLREAPGQLLFQEKLYGRESEIARLVAAFERVRTHGTSELVIVAGYSGIGKSSLVNELHRAMVPHGLFVAGKFDQYKRGIPHATLALALQGLVRPLLSKSESELAPWRSELAQALGSHGQLMVDLIPDLAVIIGEQPPVPELSASEAQGRFLQVLRQFVSVFARGKHPLVLFIDDLQWLDSESLEAFEHLAVHPEVHHLLLVGAYRENEVDSMHPLTKRLESIREARGSVEELILGPIRSEHVTSMVADAIAADPEVADPLAQVAFDKAGGNPFFTVQFVSSLVDEDLLVVEPNAGGWRWDIDRIRAKSVGDNVVGLMIERLRRLPEASLDALKCLACLGHSVAIGRFRQFMGISEYQAQSLLHETLRLGLLCQVDGAYAFAHDRVHEAVYELLSESERAVAHRTIGVHLLETLFESEANAQIFDLASHFNRSEIDSADSGVRATAASLNLRAGRKARGSAAYAAACDYFAVGRAQLGEDGWLSNYPLAFSLALEHAECSLLSGNFDGAERLTDHALSYARGAIDKAAIYRLEIELHVVRSANDAAVESALAALRLLDIDFSAHPSQEETQREFDDVWKNLGGQPLESIADLPPMTNPEMLAAMRLLGELWAPAYFTDFNLAVLAGCRMVNISLAHGSTNISNQGYALVGFFMGPVFGRYHDGYRLAHLAGELAEREKVLLHMARVGDTMAMAASWTEPLTTAIDCWRTAHRRGVEAGDVFFACYSAAHIGVHLLARGHSLQQAADECRGYLELARRSGFQAAANMILPSERAVACLRGLTQGLAEFSDDELDEAHFASMIVDSRNIVLGWYYWTSKIMLRFLAGDYRGAIEAADLAQPGLWGGVARPQPGELRSEPGSIRKTSAGFHVTFHYYTALALAARMDEVPIGEHRAMRELLDAHCVELRSWAENTRSSTFADKHVLVAAEIARLDGRDLEAQRLYEDSIRLAHESGFLQDEAIALELAARFYSRRGFDRIARAHLREARHCYQRWGADGKVRQLDDLHPLTRDERQSVGPTATTAAPIEHLDLATVIKVSQAVSGEIVLDKLVDTIMRSAMAHAGAARAVLLLSSGGELLAEAEAVIRGDAVNVDLRKATVNEIGLPESIVHYAMRSRESVIVGDALAEPPFSSDPYVTRNGARSLLCLPLTTQAKLIGLLYLENNLSAHVFSSDRIAILKLLASQAAITLENARLYRELAEREGRIRRLVDSNIVGIIFWDRDGRLLDANDAFLRMVRYERADLDKGLKWADMLTSEWKGGPVFEDLEVLKATGALQPREKEYFRKDGSRLPVLLGAATFEDQPDQGLAFILDLTEVKQAEARIRESEQRYRELQAELAHANRIATMGQLLAWIGHDVSQPLASLLVGGEAGLNWLAADPPNLQGARRALERMIRDGQLAADILHSIRAMARKTPSRRVPIDINNVISETFALIEAESQRNGIAVQIDLAESLPVVAADPIQIQQVVLNLSVNAIEAMAEDSARKHQLTIASSEDASEGVVVTVRDTGPGLIADQQERVFEAFHTSKSSGLGMGLAICRTIVESHGGSIWVTPNEPRGAVFRFTLPLTPAEGRT